MKKVIRLILVFLLIFSLSSCAAMRKKKKSRPEFVVHTVKYTGETLGFISRWYTGDFAKWQEIQKYNAIKKPNAIYLGQEIKIPSYLIVEDSPPPKSFFRGGNVSVDSGSKNVTKSSAEQAPERKPAKPISVQVVAEPEVVPAVSSGSMLESQEVEQSDDVVPAKSLLKVEQGDDVAVKEDGLRKAVSVPDVGPEQELKEIKEGSVGAVPAATTESIEPLDDKARDQLLDELLEEAE